MAVVANDAMRPLPLPFAGGIITGAAAVPVVVVLACALWPQRLVLGEAAVVFICVAVVAFVKAVGVTTGGVVGVGAIFLRQAWALLLLTLL